MARSSVSDSPIKTDILAHAVVDYLAVAGTLQIRNIRNLTNSVARNKLCTVRDATGCSTPCEHRSDTVASSALKQIAEDLLNGYEIGRDGSQAQASVFAAFDARGVWLSYGHGQQHVLRRHSSKLRFCNLTLRHRNIALSVSLC